MAELQVSVVQSPGALDGVAARLNWLNQRLADAGTRATDLMHLPELFQSGYNIGDAVTAQAEPRDGPFAKALSALARTHGTAILTGYAERHGEQFFNSAICLDKTGATVGHHRKLLLPPGFEGDHFTPGDGCTLFDLNGLSVAILVCYDVEFPENLRHVAMAGADLVAVPTALGAQWGVVAEKLVPTRAFENGVYVAYANHAGAENGLEYFGGSCICGPDGKDLARAGAGDCVIHAHIAKDAVKAAQARLPYHSDRARLPWV